MSKQRRGKRKKGRGPRPPKPPEKRSLRRPPAPGLASAAEIAAWNAAAAQPEEGFGGWSEGPDAGPAWSELSQLESQLADLLGEFVEEVPAAGTLDQVQALFEALCQGNSITAESLQGWAAAILHRVAEENSALESVSPALERRFALTPGQAAEWAARLRVALGEDAQA